MILIPLALVLVLGTLQIQVILANMKRQWSGLAIAMLMFVPGFAFDSFIRYAFVDQFCPLAWWQQLVFSHTRNAVGAFTSTMCAFACPSLVLWWGMGWVQKALRPKNGDERTPAIWKGIVLLVLAIYGMDRYVADYKTLMEGVESKDLKLSHRRLHFNLLGVDANNGIVFALSSEIHTFPLLPVAVEGGNYAMIDLLLEHGAELNPADWNRSLNPTERNYTRNTLYFAIVEKDRNMLDYLLEKGADPSQGIATAYDKKDVEILDYLYSRGANPTPALVEYISGQQWVCDPGIIDHLLEFGADPTAGIAPALTHYQLGVVAHLVAAGGDATEGIQVAIDQGSRHGLEQLLALGADREVARQALRNHPPRSKQRLKEMWELVDTPTP